MLGLVIVCFFISQIAVLIVAGYIDGDMNGTVGPLDPFFTFLGGICLSPFLLLFFYLRRPKLTHTVQAYPADQGAHMHALSGGMVVKSPRRPAPPLRSTALEMPRPFHLWMLFVFGVGVSTVCLLPLTIYGANALTLMLALAVVLPAWLIGFATPVFAWWSITSRHLGIHASRRDAEWMLAAGMLSTVPAIVINSVISPILVALVGLDAFTAGTLGEGLILFVSAPVGEELSKALAVMALSHLIVSPKHGFYVGSTVGLGFALLENASYISMALASDYSSITYFFTASLRGLSSIPGHAMWTGLSGYAIGCWLGRGNALPTLSGTSYLSEDADARWVLYDKQGRAVPQDSWSNMPSQAVVKLLGRHRQHAWPMPTTLGAGLETGDCGPRPVERLLVGRGNAAFWQRHGARRPASVGVAGGDGLRPLGLHPTLVAYHCAQRARMTKNRHNRVWSSKARPRWTRVDLCVHCPAGADHGRLFQRPEHR